ncbi:unnamed protein product [Nesidiocoris tenuis]|uniref:Uncharacterized protein n=1 Tax=Nesidiocoris tenuis TaxID=355587 RepID=A0A6H5G710_9HEMI|nr:unnamed protein product [Nesidiocoris tenuis]
MFCWASRNKGGPIPSEKEVKYGPITGGNGRLIPREPSRRTIEHNVATNHPKGMYRHGFHTKGQSAIRLEARATARYRIDERTRRPANYGLHMGPLVLVWSSTGPYGGPPGPPISRLCGPSGAGANKSSNINYPGQFRCTYQFEPV